jgi:hypothetical protein
MQRFNWLACAGTALLIGLVATSGLAASGEAMSLAPVSEFVMPDGPAIMADCPDIIYDSGDADGVNGYRPTVGWTTGTGMLEDILLDEEIGSEFQCIRTEWITSIPVGSFSDVRIKLYDAPGGLPSLGNYGTATPFYDHLYSGSEKIITDSGIDYFGRNLLYADLEAADVVDMGAINRKGMLVLLPTSGTDCFWATAPANGSDGGYIWGSDVPTPSPFGVNLAFNVMGVSSGEPPVGDCDLTPIEAKLDVLEPKADDLGVVIDEINVKVDALEAKLDEGVEVDPCDIVRLLTAPMLPKGPVLPTTHPCYVAPEPLRLRR